jgi:hypothetical protein
VISDELLVPPAKRRGQDTTGGQSSVIAILDKHEIFASGKTFECVCGPPVVISSVDVSILFPDSNGHHQHDQGEVKRCFESHHTDRMPFGKRFMDKRALPDQNLPFEASGRSAMKSGIWQSS